jgi:hypothetical protein
MMHRSVKAELTIVAMAITLAGCSSGTEPRSDAAAQGYALRIVASPASPTIGDTITITFTIENATSNTLTRTFADFWMRPQMRVVSGAGIFATGNGFGDEVGEGQAVTTLVLEPHQVVTGVSTLVAVSTGNAELTGCLPADAATGANAICTDAFVTVGAR